jgi:hypothetical protein
VLQPSNPPPPPAMLLDTVKRDLRIREVHVAENRNLWRAIVISFRFA